MRLLDLLNSRRSYLHTRIRHTGALLPVVALSVVSVVLWLPRIAGPLDLRWDGAAYYVLGTSLAEGKGYRLLNEPGDIEACQYPPLLPLIAAVPQMILGTSDPVVVGRWLKLIFFCFHGGLAAATYFMLRMFVPRWLAFVGALALLLNVQATFYSSLFFSEIPYALVTVLFVLSRRGSANQVQEKLPAALAVTAFLLRTAGVALLAAWIGEALLRSQFRRAAGRLLISAIPVLCWSAHVLRVERSASYANPAYPYQRAPYLNHNVSYAANVLLEDAYSPGFASATPRQLVSRLPVNAPVLGIAIGEAVSDSRGYWRYRWKSVCAGQFRRWCVGGTLILLGGLVVGGLGVLIVRRDFFIPIYVLAALILVSVTPWPEQFRRYLTTLLPFLLVALFVCALSAGNRLRTFWPRLGRLCAPIGLTVVLALVFDAEVGALRGLYRRLDEVSAPTRDGRVVNYRQFYYGANEKALDDGLRWLRERARPQDVIVTSMPHWAYLITGLKAVRPPLEYSGERTQMLLDSVPAAYVVLDFRNVGSYAIPYLLPVVQEHPRSWKPVYADQAGEVAIYERVRPEDEDVATR